MNGEALTLLPAIYTVLVIGAGYIVLWLKCKIMDTCPFLPEKRNAFYEMSSYDKAIQSLIAGILVIAVTCFLSKTSLDLISDIKQFLESGKLIPFLALQLYIIFVLSINWVVFEVHSTKKGWLVWSVAFKEWKEKLNPNNKKSKNKK